MISILARTAAIFVVISQMTFSAVDASPPTAAEYYAQAIARMQSLPLAPRVEYQMSVKGRGAHITLMRDARGVLQMSMLSGSSPNPQRWVVNYTDVAHTASVAFENGSKAVTHIALFNPTWEGAYEWLLNGMFGAPERDINAHPNAMPSTKPILSVIASVTAMAPSAYEISDSGAQTCPGGESGHALLFSPRTSSSSHPLRRAVVAVSSGLICSLEFDMRGSGGIVGVTGVVVINFRNIENHWVSSDGQVNMEGRFLGFGVEHIALDFKREHITFGS